MWLGNEGENIQAVIQGKKPVLLLRELNQMIQSTCFNYPGMKLLPFFICPKCLTDMIIANTLVEYKELPEKVTKSKFAAGDIRNGENTTMCCSQKRHRVLKLVVVNGYNPFDSSVNIFSEDVSREREQLLGLLNNFGDKQI